MLKLWVHWRTSNAKPPGSYPGAERVQELCFCFAAIGNEVTCEAGLDGEIVCIDAEGRPQFYELLRRRGDPVFYVFDLMWLDGEDLRELRRSAAQRSRYRKSWTAPCSPLT